MRKVSISSGTFVTVIALLAPLALLAALSPLALPALPGRPGGPAASSATPPSTASPDTGHEGLLYGRVTGVDGALYEGRLRFGEDEEAFWGHYFNGVKNENPWAMHLPPERLVERRPPLEIFGIEIPLGKRRVDLGRPLMARFGDIARIEARGRDLRVTLKSGTVFRLDRFAADDFADGLRVWDRQRGVVDLDEWRVKSIDFLPTARVDGAGDRLYGTVRARRGDFTGFIQWDREQSVGSDTLAGDTPDGELSLRFETIRSIARHSGDSSLITLRDGREIVLSNSRGAGRGHRGIYVDDNRYGRVLVSWDAFEEVEFNPPGGATTAGEPSYTDFPPGRPLTGTVTTRAGRRLTGRLVYDLDESETTETLDAPSHGVDYTIPLGLIASIALKDPGTGDAERIRVTLHDREELQLERAGDLSEANAGLLVFVHGYDRPEYVQWADVAQVDFDRPPAMYPPLAEH